MIAWTTLTIRDNAPGSPHIVNLLGTSTPGVPLLNWSVPDPIIYGTVLNSKQLNATASFPGTFAYSPPLGAVLGAGSQTLSVTFTPADTTDYITVRATVRVQVNRATLKITANNATKVFNTPNPPLASTASGFVDSEGMGVLNTIPVCATTATTTSPVGGYPITCSGATAANYTITYVPGTLTVTCHRSAGNFSFDCRTGSQDNSYGDRDGLHICWPDDKREVHIDRAAWRILQ